MRDMKKAVRMMKKERLGIVGTYINKTDGKKAETERRKWGDE